MPELTRSPCRAGLPKDWVLYACHATPLRLVVFVHGFRGGSVKTWRQFANLDDDEPWWSESDLLFVGYDSVRDTILGVASRLRRELPRFYPTVRSDELAGLLDLLHRGPTAYDELVLVGHSLGGLILRRALADCAEDWVNQRAGDPTLIRPAILGARTRLFSPASAGFRSAGALGVLQASPAWFGLNLLLRFSPSYTDLQPGSEVLQATRRRTERIVMSEPTTDTGALSAQIVWAGPDNVVTSERYDTDPVDDVIDGRTHVNVCKPDTDYQVPRAFVRGVPWR